MKTTFALLLACPLAVTSCIVPPSHADPKVHGPRGGIAFHVAVDSKPQGARIELNDAYMGTTPTNIIIWGDADGTFHSVGQPYCVVRVYPTGEGQYVQTKSFVTGWRSREELIPQTIFFDLTVPTVQPLNPVNPPPGTSAGAKPAEYKPSKAY